MTRKIFFVGTVRDLEIIPIRQYHVAGKSIMLSRVGTAYYATDAICTHKDVFLVMGELEGSIISCPEHGGAFDVSTGAATSLPAVAPLATYPVDVIGGDIFISIDQRPFPHEIVKKQFPIFDAIKGGFYYLDNAATMHKPQSVIDGLCFFYSNLNSNVHRGSYPLSELATEAYEHSRGRIAQFIHADSHEVVFTKGATESINLAAYSWGDANIHAGDEIMISVSEHHSNFIPWQQLALRRGAILKIIPCREGGRVAFEDFARELSGKTKIVAIAHVSNVTGAILPIREIIVAAHDVGAKVLIDAAQSVAHMAIDVRALDCDWLAFSGHKAYGPTGIGILYGKMDVLGSMPPFLFGGGMIKDVSSYGAQWIDPPHIFEAGTPPIAEAVAFAAAIDWLEGVGLEAIAEHEADLIRYAADTLGQVPKLHIIGPDTERRSSILSFSIEDVHAHDIADLAGDRGVCIRAGYHCAKPLHDALGLSASCRLSVAAYNSREDIHMLAEALDRGMKILKR